MGHVRAQITTRSGPAGTKDTKVVIHGDYSLSGRGAPRTFTDTLLGCLEAAKGISKDGMVTEVAVLVYPDELGLEVTDLG